MTKKDNNKIISVVHPICWGLDVHKNITGHMSILAKRILFQRARKKG